MPKHYALGENLLKGTASFKNSKWAYVTFRKPNGAVRAFTKKPTLMTQPVGSATAPSVRGTDWIKNANGEYIGAKIGFNNAETIDVDWEVKE